MIDFPANFRSAWEEISVAAGAYTVYNSRVSSFVENIVLKQNSTIQPLSLAICLSLFYFENDNIR